MIEFLITRKHVPFAAAFAAILAIVPARALAAVDAATCRITGSLESIHDLFILAICFISRYIVPLMFALAIVFFIYGVIGYIKNADNEAERTKGRDFMIWGIIALFVMVSVWGIVNLLRNTFSLNDQELPIPQFPVDLGSGE